MCAASNRPCVSFAAGQGPWTPWGRAEDVTTYGPGVQFYSCPDHGGFQLNEQRRRAVERLFPRCVPVIAHEWFEEDCAWALVALAFPSLFDRDALEMAMRTARGMVKLNASGAEHWRLKGNTSRMRDCEGKQTQWQTVVDWLDGEAGRQHLRPYVDGRLAPVVVRIAVG